MKRSDLNQTASSYMKNKISKLDNQYHPSSTSSKSSSDIFHECYVFVNGIVTVCVYGFYFLPTNILKYDI